jgi:hypothetical protein
MHEYERNHNYTKYYAAASSNCKRAKPSSIDLYYNQYCLNGKWWWHLRLGNRLHKSWYTGCYRRNNGWDIHRNCNWIKWLYSYGKLNRYPKYCCANCNHNQFASYKRTHLQHYYNKSNGKWRH